MGVLGFLIWMESKKKSESPPLMEKECSVLTVPVGEYGGES